jgi:GT2 family glycosyltransferase
VIKIANAWLVLTIHLDAFRAAPRAYLTAAKWWVLRKRVRARGQFAPLLARSPRAYALWGVRDEWANRDPSPQGQSPPIIALVACDGPSAALDQTLRSLAAEGLTALTVGADPAHDLDAATAAIDWADGPWLLPLAAGDRLAPGAAAAYRAAMTDPAARLIYADDDLLDRWDRRGAPHFKPEWNSELFDHHDYLTGACIVQAGRDDLAAVARQTDWAAALVARALTADGALARIRPTPIRRVLHHRCTRPQPRLPLAALPLAADLPLVSVIIPTRNRVDLLRTCLAGVAAAHYPAIEVIVVDNDSDDPATLDFLAGLEGSGGRVLRHAGPFNYPAINNRAVAEAKGDLICLLNNDIEMLAPDWLAIMATQALRDEVGAVGAQLLYPDGRIQHAGVVIGVGNAAGHAHRFLRPGETGYFHRHALPQFVSAVTAACLVVKRDRFLAVGGLDATGFPVAFNDVDLCLKLNQCGWQSFYEPRAVLVHHESVSRGFDHDPAGAARFAGELAALQQIWQTDEIVDPFHHPQLSRASEQFVVAL